jgi:hypothetical protein
VFAEHLQHAHQSKHKSGHTSPEGIFHSHTSPARENCKELDQENAESVG